MGILRDTGKIAAETIEPLEDIQASAGYRRDLVRAMVRRALDQAFKR
jgi:CO/xanthine dehydrogenase FAD-binding subunit